MLSTLFPFVKSSPAAPVNHPAENGIDLGVIMAPRSHSRPGHLRPFIPWAVPASRVFAPKREGKLAERFPVAMLFFTQVGRAVLCAPRCCENRANWRFAARGGLRALPCRRLLHSPQS